MRLFEIETNHYDEWYCDEFPEFIEANTSAEAIDYALHYYVNQCSASGINTDGWIIGDDTIECIDNGVKRIIKFRAVEVS